MKDTQDSEALVQEAMGEQFRDKAKCDKAYTKGYREGRSFEDALRNELLKRIEEMEEKGYEEKTIIESIKNYLRFGV